MRQYTEEEKAMIKQAMLEAAMMNAVYWSDLRDTVHRQNVEASKAAARNDIRWNVRLNGDSDYPAVIA